MSRDNSESSLDKQLDKLETYFEIGDFKQARKLADHLADAHDLTEAEQSRIGRVLSASNIDPMGIGAIVFTIALLIHLFVVYGV